MRMSAAVIAVMAVIVLASGCGREKSPVIARVNQKPITQQQLWEALEKNDTGDAARRTLDSLIVRELIRQEAKKRGIEVAPQELQSRLDGMKDYVLAGTGKSFEAWLADTGQTQEDLAGRISLQMLTGKLVITQKDREQYFEENKERLASDLPHNNEAVIYRQIVVGSKEEAEGVRRELTAAKSGKGGADFAKIAEARSLDPMTRARGGMAGWVVKGKSTDAKLEQVLFSLKPGEISQPVPLPLPAGLAPEGGEEGKQPEWWAVLKVEKYLPPHEITLEGNADVIEEWMMGDPRFQMQLQEFFTGLRSRADVQIASPQYRMLQEAYQRQREARQQRLEGTQAVPLAPEGVGGAPPPARGERRAVPAAPRGRSR